MSTAAVPPAKLQLPCPRVFFGHSEATAHYVIGTAPFPITR